MSDHTTEELLDLFLENGGRVSEIYLQNLNLAIPQRPSIVYINNNFYSGATTRIAILKALTSLPKN